MARARRDLSPDDLKIWRHVTRSITPFEGHLEGMARHPSDDDVADEAPARKRAAPVTEPAVHVVVRPPLQPQPLKMGSTADIDRRTAQRFQRGEMHVDGRIDLHGLTLEQAHGALTSFIRGAAARGSRCVMVVTGKGKGGSIGKIRAEAPHWLNQASLRPLILAVSQARIQHGGTGALYVLLKRQR